MVFAFVDTLSVHTFRLSFVSKGLPEVYIMERGGVIAASLTEKTYFMSTRRKTIKPIGKSPIEATSHLAVELIGNILRLPLPNVINAKLTSSHARSF